MLGDSGASFTCGVCDEKKALNRKVFFFQFWLFVSANTNQLKGKDALGLMITFVLVDMYDEKEALTPKVMLQVTS